MQNTGFEPALDVLYTDLSEGRLKDFLLQAVFVTKNYNRGVPQRVALKCLAISSDFDLYQFVQTRRSEW